MSLRAAKDISKVNYIIHRCLSEDIRLLVQGKSMYEAWETLKERYGQEVVQNHSELHKEYMNKVGDDPALFVVKLDTLLNRYERATGTSFGDTGRSLILKERLPA